MKRLQEINLLTEKQSKKEFTGYLQNIGVSLKKIEQCGRQLHCRREKRILYF